MTSCSHPALPAPVLVFLDPPRIANVEASYVCEACSLVLFRAAAFDVGLAERNGVIPKGLSAAGIHKAVEGLLS